MTLALRLSEAIQAVPQRRAVLLAPLEAEVMGKLARAWVIQGRVFVEAWGKVDNDPGPAFARAERESRDEMRRALEEPAGRAWKIGAERVEKMLREAELGGPDNPLAVRYFEDFGATRITRIDETTRSYIKTVIRNGLANGTPYEELARRITQRYGEFGAPSPLGHIRSRAELVAVTEMGDAYAEATMVQAREAEALGIAIEKKWLSAGDRKVDETICRRNENEGWIPLNEPFPSGVDRPTGHPGCRCDVLTRRKPSTPRIPPVRTPRPRAPRAPRPPAPARVVATNAYPVEGFATRKAAEAFMRGKYGHVLFDVDGMAIDVVNQTFAELDRLATAFPDVMAGLRYIGTRPTSVGGPRMPRNAYAYATRDGRFMAFNKQHIADGAKLQRARAQELVTGWSSTDSWEGVVAHEWGHHVDFWIQRTRQGKIADLDSPEFLTGSLHSKLRRMPDAKDVSQYGRTNAEEAWAEAFAARTTMPRETWKPYTVRVDKWLTYLETHPDVVRQFGGGRQWASLTELEREQLRAISREIEAIFA